MSPRTTYGIVSLLLVGLVISAGFGVYYYNQFVLESQVASKYVSDLTDSNAQYDRLASQYNTSLGLYNQTLALLAGTVGAVNTSLPIYGQASSQLSGLWGAYLKLKPQAAKVYTADVLFDFGNGTRHWYNNTQIQPGWNLYTVTVVLTGGDMKATWYPSFGEHLVSALWGVTGTKTSYWLVWTYNSSSLWQEAQVGADLLPVDNGSVFAWTFCAQTCKP